MYVFFFITKGAQESDHSQAQAESQMEHVGHQQINMVQLLTVSHEDKHLLMWENKLVHLRPIKFCGFFPVY